MQVVLWDGNALGLGIILITFNNVDFNAQSLLILSKNSFKQHMKSGNLSSSVCVPDTIYEIFLSFCNNNNNKS